MKSLISKLFFSFFLLLSSICFLSYCNNLPTTKSYSQEFEIPNLYLDFFSEKRASILINYLVKNSTWHVTPINGTVIAIKREPGKLCNPTMLPLPYSYPSRKVPPLTVNFFNLYSAVAQPSEDYFLENKARENSRITLRMEHKYYRIDNQNKTLYLMIESQNKKISLHIFESSKDAPSQSTTNFLMSVRNELEQLAKVVPRVDQGIDLPVLPSGSVISADHPSFLIRKLEQESRGTYSVSGYVNPGEEGLVYLKVINKKTGEIILSESEGTNAEYVGWSNNPNQKFNFCLGIKGLKATAKDGSELLAEFQLWFKPSNHRAERMLSTQTLLAELSI